MSDRQKPQSGYWVIAVLGLIWNVMGCWNYISQTSPEAIANMPKAYQVAVNSRPALVTAAFSIGVFGGTLGCVLMIIQRAIARPVLLISLVGIVVTMVHAILAIGTEAGAVLIIAGIGLSVIISTFFIWYTHRKVGLALLH
ncbi:MAG: hypothetical protein RI861_08635, partial [Planktomarina sp.]|nr:hypothetical protein [Planktomarina sp.]